MANDVLSVELEIKDGNADVVLSRTKQKLEDFVKTAEKAQPNIKFSIPNQNFIDLDKLEKKADEIRKQFQEITKVSIGSGTFTKDIFTAQNRARQLADDIVNIRKELANPARSSSIAFLTQELKGAERELDSLTGKLKTLPSPSTDTGGKPSTRRRGISETQRAILEVADDFAPAGLNRPFNAVARGILEAVNAKTALTAATTASTAATAASTAATTAEGTAMAATTTAVEAETAAFAGLSLASLGVFAGVAAAGFAVYKITRRIRDEAEHQLKVQNEITGEINKQLLAGIELKRAFAEQSANAARSDNFSRSVQGETVEQLTHRQQALQQALEQSKIIRTGVVLTSGDKSDQFKKIENDIANENRELLEVEKRLRELPFENNKRLDEAFNKSSEDFKKSQADNAQFQKKLDEEAFQRKEKIQQKIKELEKQYVSTFDALNTRTGANNPIYTAFNQGDIALRELRKNLAGLPGELQKIAIAAQEKLNLQAKLSVAVDNKLASFDLRNDAANFRNPFDAAKQKLEEDQFVKRFLQANPNYLFLKKQEYDQKNLVGGLTSFTSFEDEIKKDILDRGKPTIDSPENRFNKSLEDKFNLLYKPRQNSEKLAKADKTFIALTQGANPANLSTDLREGAAIAREREAARLENYQREANRLLKENLEVNKQLLADAKNKTALATKGGANALKVLIQDETKDGVNYEYLPDRPQGGATVQQYRPSTVSGRGGLTNY